MQPKVLPERIVSKRILLRRIQVGDTLPFYEFLRDEDNVRYMFYSEEQRTLEGAKMLVDETIASYDTPDPACSFAIADFARGDYLGHIGAQAFQNTSDMEIFYTLLPQYRGQGYVTEALEAFLDYLFADGTMRVVAIIMPENVSSRRVINRFGAECAGEIVVHGKIALRYGLDRETFEQWKTRAES